MNLFFSALRVDGRPISKTELFSQIARLPRNIDYQSVTTGPFAAIALGEKHALRPLLSQRRGCVLVGDVRLDNRAELVSLARDVEDSATDLAVVGAAIDRVGADVIPRIHGDFSFVFWDARAQKVLAARDAFGVKPLYYRREGDYLFIASRLSPLIGDGAFDQDYIADMLVGLPSLSRSRHQSSMSSYASAACATRAMPLRRQSSSCSRTATFAIQAARFSCVYSNGSGR
jgi:hypothetical protein